ncbi:hypothetical protein [Paenirhodobacter sp. CAU 1674]|jgi:hypothetical protein|uniref:hypothetical protein n=1 Tax=Paenirhodobacter sp. CAU 1674 TaxID=3032596 RepID=UPI0023DA0456|nr:hypothetical protein [Paenirhodobacter sp. CAU 1674]MDF2141254.1 hypothetical protein [Paenirhodobacter sp. CAU 1674]
MSRRTSMNARAAQQDASTGDIEVVLMEIRHPDLEAPIRLSTDNTERVSDDPLIYGTRSSWRGADPETDPYLWIIASSVLPDDDADTPAAAQIVLENMDARIVEVLRSFTSQATIALAVVLASSPDVIEVESQDMRMTTADGTAAEIVLSLGREEIELEMFPAGRMTRQKFPGLWR